MVFGVQPLETFPRDVRIYLCRGKIAVPKEQLYHPQVRAVVQQMGRKRVPQHVG